MGVRREMGGGLGTYLADPSFFGLYEGHIAVVVLWGQRRAVEWGYVPGFPRCRCQCRNEYRAYTESMCWRRRRTENKQVQMENNSNKLFIPLAHESRASLVDSVQDYE